MKNPKPYDGTFNVGDEIICYKRSNGMKCWTATVQKIMSDKHIKVYRNDSGSSGWNCCRVKEGWWSGNAHSIGQFIVPGKIKNWKRMIVE